MAKKKRKDPRQNRRSINITFDYDKPDERVVVDYHKALVSGGIGDKTWKHQVKKAILLQIAIGYDDIKALRSASPELADALMLYRAIKYGDLSIMKELFPDRYEAFRLQMESDVLEKTNIQSNHDVMAKLEEIKRQIDKAQMASPKQNDNTIQQIGASNPLPMPVFDDDDDDLFDVRKDKNSGEIAAMNFIQSLKNLNGGEL
jgi:hypothetical protein